MKTYTERPKIRVLVADDHALILRMICDFLSQEPDIEVVGQASDGDSAIEAVTSAQPHVMILDVRMPNLGGIEAIPRIKEKWPHIHVICMSITHEESVINEAFNVGASGYMFKGGTGHEFADSVRTVVAGGRYLSQRGKAART
ncbi:MAG: response regulator transcription factor [Lentisphaeria bacterium]|nr:response regulator transcription factor [Lentisphaeria bacterium]